MADKTDNIPVRGIERDIKNVKLGFKNAAQKFGLNEAKSQSLDSNSSSSSMKFDKSRKMSLGQNGPISSHLRWAKNKESKWVPQFNSNNNDADVQVFNNNIRRISLQQKVQSSARFLTRKLSNESYFGPVSRKSSLDSIIFKKETNFKKTASEISIFASKENLNLVATKKDEDDDTSTLTSESLSQKHCHRDDDSDKFVEFDEIDSLLEKPK